MSPALVFASEGAVQIPERVFATVRKNYFSHGILRSNSRELISLQRIVHCLKNAALIASLRFKRPPAVKNETRFNIATDSSRRAFFS